MIKLELPKEIEEKLLQEEDPSRLVDMVLEGYYSALDTESMSFSDTLERMFDEVEDFIVNKAIPNYPFDLNRASATFRSAPTVSVSSGLRQSGWRASLGAAFRREIGQGVFSRVKVALNPFGDPIRSSNGALMYVIR